MTVRLAFSVAIQVDAEILLIDEVLAVGDARFQQKCFDEFQRLKREGRTILFVTHDMSAVERFCDRAMLLDKGRMIAIGEPAAIARRYNELNFGRTIHTLSEDRTEAEQRAERRDADIVDAWFEDAGGARVTAIAHRETCVACIEVRFNVPLDDPIFGVDAAQRRRRNGVRHDHGVRARTNRALRSRREHRRARALRDLVHAHRYTLTPSIARAGTGADAIDLRDDLASIVVHGGHFTTASSISRTSSRSSAGEHPCRSSSRGATGRLRSETTCGAS